MLDNNKSRLFQVINTAFIDFNKAFKSGDLKEASILYSLIMDEATNGVASNQISLDEYYEIMADFTNKQVYKVTDYMKDEYWHSKREDLKLYFTDNEIDNKYNKYIEVLPDNTKDFDDLLGITFRDNEAFNRNYYVEVNKQSYEPSLLMKVSLKDEIKNMPWRKVEALFNELYPEGINDNNYNKLKLFNEIKNVYIPLNNEQYRQLNDAVITYEERKETEKEEHDYDRE